MSPPAPLAGSDGDRVLVLNPAAGDGEHAATIYDLAGQYDFEIRETDSAEDVVETAADAAPDASMLAAAGGDGTLTRAVRGIDRADAFDDTTFGVVPAGTGNSFAGNLGITGLEHAFEVLTEGEIRTIDVGTIDDTPFLNSVVAGLTAESSADTASASKERWGVLAYAMTTASTAAAFDGLHLTIDPVDSDPWETEAGIVMIGNGRRFPRPGGSQAHLEDGLLDVAVVEQASTLELAGQSLRHAVSEADGVAEFRTQSVTVEIHGDRDRISVDGEIETAESFSAGVRPGVLELAVGESYDPDPDGYESDPDGDDPEPERDDPEPDGSADADSVPTGLEEQ
ncbi:hypothetical protein L593_04580 [Salinarchaeum sp. Harcht-Bsk1]|uniref:diacylglycerol/lipid kinase family protein n=1 Tax=Salinarchaeum sp. Harcht-Bsk1 TaxID=1333523 RepID=UPI000342341D|nr:diacylglycerol kinase family protein [Salinarchaeum sp. Harcht-Bsk1]AGN00865.1 hypothetical protein L593_04580 [Salinarchaeum sp. Harcht-Bsk1]